MAVAASLAGCSLVTGSSSGGARGTPIPAGEGQAAGEAGSGLDRTVPPTPRRPPPFRSPPVRELELEGGLRVVLVERRRRPLVALTLVVRGGAAAQAPAEAGLAGLVADMLDEGSARWTAQEIAEILEGLGASLESTATRDATYVRLEVLRPRLAEALDVLTEIVLRPTFPERELERVRGERMARLLRERDDPGIVAERVLAEALYGPEHPYGQPLLGTETSLSRLGRDAVAAYHRRLYHAGNAVLVAVGDLDEEGLRELLEPALGGWPAAPRWERDPPPVPEPPEGGARIYLLDRPGAPQSEVRVGRISAERRNPDFHDLTVLNTVLGGSFTSRLNARLREEQGYTYGASSAFAATVWPGPFVARTAVHTPATADAVADMLREIRRMLDENASAEEVDRARAYVVGRLSQRLETTPDLADRLAEVVLHDLPTDHWDEFAAAVRAVIPGDVRRAARAHLDPGSMAVVVVGDRAAVEAPLRRLGVGEVVSAPAPGRGGSVPDGASSPSQPRDGG